LLQFSNKDFTIKTHSLQVLKNNRNLSLGKGSYGYFSNWIKSLELRKILKANKFSPLKLLCELVNFSLSYSTSWSPQH
jgi:hypothetical protein